MLYESLPTARRLRLHGRVGEALQSVFAADPKPHLAALDLAERPDLQPRCQLLLALGEARMAASEVPAARTAYQQAGELARRLGAPELLARAALGPGLEFTAGIVDPVEVGLLEEAL